MSANFSSKHLICTWWILLWICTRVCWTRSLRRSMLKVPTGCLAHRYVYVIITRCTCLAWSKFRIAAIKSFILYVMLCYLTSFGYLRLLDAAVDTVRLNFGFQSDWCWIHCTYLGKVRVTECIVTRWSTRLTWSACLLCPDKETC